MHLAVGHLIHGPEQIKDLFHLSLKLVLLNIKVFEAIHMPTFVTCFSNML